MRIRSSLLTLADLGVVAQPARRILAMVMLGAATLMSTSAIPAQAPNSTVVIGGLMWATTSNGEDVHWGPAKEFCDALALAGHSDWRLPTLTEVESLYDPANEANGYFVNPLKIPGCCLWSSTTLADLSPAAGGVQSATNERLINVKMANSDLKAYFWGFLFTGGIRYYSINYMPDGQALCVRAAKPAGS